ncbi:MAG TPA: carboxyltransferase domain-containing protein, partial [Methylocystis sp.]|nr:carboxyltransferase domain-containing protein [Methylocystis sp.]
MLYAKPRHLDAGEAALSVEFGDSVDPAINARVLALDAALRAAALPGVEETVPTYRALLIFYDPLALSRESLVATIEAFETKVSAPAAPSARWR